MKELKVSNVALWIISVLMVAMGVLYYLMLGGMEIGMAGYYLLTYSIAAIVPVLLFLFCVGGYTRLTASTGQWVALSFLYCLLGLGSFLATTQGWSALFMIFYGLVFFAGLFILLLIIILFKNKPFSAPAGLVIALLSIHTMALILNNGDGGDNGGMATFLEILAKRAIFGAQNAFLISIASKVVYILSLLGFIGWMMAYKAPTTDTASFPQTGGAGLQPPIRPNPVPRAISIILMILVGLGAAYITGYWLYEQANPSDPRAQYELGESCLKQGKDAEAVKWLTKAANAKIMNAFYPLGKCYEEGRGGLKVDYIEAYKDYSLTMNGSPNPQKWMPAVYKAKMALEAKLSAEEKQEALIRQTQWKYNLSRQAAIGRLEESSRVPEIIRNDFIKALGYDPGQQEVNYVVRGYENGTWTLAQAEDWATKRAKLLKRFKERQQRSQVNPNTPNTAFVGFAVKKGTAISNGNIEFIKSGFKDLSVSAHGGKGDLSATPKGVSLSTRDFIWETFAFNLTDNAQIATVDYALSVPGKSVLGLYVDGTTMEYIQNMPENDLDTEAMFSLPAKITPGTHQLTISFESLDKVPLTLTLEELGFYHKAVSSQAAQPLVPPSSTPPVSNSNVYNPEYLNAAPGSVEAQLAAEGKTWAKSDAPIVAGCYVEDILPNRLNQPSGRGKIGKVVSTASDAAQVDFGRGYVVGLNYNELSALSVEEQPAAPAQTRKNSAEPRNPQ